MASRVVVNEIGNSRFQCSKARHGGFGDMQVYSETGRGVESNAGKDRIFRERYV